MNNSQKPQPQSLWTLIRKILATVLLVAYFATEPLKYVAADFVPTLQSVIRWALLGMGGIGVLITVVSAIIVLKRRTSTNVQRGGAIFGLVLCVPTVLMIWWASTHSMLTSSEPMQDLTGYFISMAICGAAVVLMWVIKPPQPAQKPAASGTPKS